jgi:hypothetical protein
MLTSFAFSGDSGTYIGCLNIQTFGEMNYVLDSNRTRDVGAYFQADDTCHSSEIEVERGGGYGILQGVQNCTYLIKFRIFT